MIIGAGAGKTGLKYAAEAIKRGSGQLSALLVEHGTDVTLSVAGDLAMIGLLDYEQGLKETLKQNGIGLLVSTLTDIVDGFIARRFNMVTDFGKFIDPVADKATQLTIFICLITKFPLMALPFGVLLVKEIGSLLLRLAVYKKTDVVEGAHWHGKVSTGIVILIIVLHLAMWDNIPDPISDALILFSTIFMVYSGFLYTLEGIDLLKNGKKY